LEDIPDIFDFLMVLVSIIIGFGMTEVLAGSARLLRARNNTKPYWLHTVLVLGVFITLLTMWWEAWGLQSETEWSFLGLIFMLSGPVGLYLIASLSFPDQVEDHDFREYYYQNASLIWMVAGISSILNNSFWILYLGSDLLEPDSIFSLINILVAFILVFVKKPLVHALGLPIFFILIFSDQLFFRFSIS
jgi:multisubunit Na+/H+ antiporter MnhG subunit